MTPTKTEVDSAINSLERGESSINVGRLGALANYIVEHPYEFDMGEWEGRRLLNRWITTHKIWGCTTTHCIAGLTCDMWANGQAINATAPAAAQLLLGLTYAQADRLFYLAEWPEPYHSDYGKPRYAQGNAWVAAERIRYFIRTNGRE